MTSEAEERQIIGERDYKIAEVNANPDLTEQAKQRYIDELQAWAKQEINSVREHDKRQSEARLRQAKQAVYNVPTGNKPTGAEQSQIWSGFRAAWADVLSVSTGHELGSILDQAERTGDAHLARAAYHRGLDLGAQEVVDRFLADKPGEAKALERYNEAVQEMNQYQSFEGLFEQAMTDKVFAS